MLIDSVGTRDRTNGDEDATVLDVGVMKLGAAEKVSLAAPHDTWRPSGMGHAACALLSVVGKMRSVALGGIDCRMTYSRQSRAGEKHLVAG